MNTIVKDINVANFLTALDNGFTFIGDVKISPELVKLVIPRLISHNIFLEAAAEYTEREELSAGYSLFDNKNDSEDGSLDFFKENKNLILDLAQKITQNSTHKTMAECIHSMVPSDAYANVNINHIQAVIEGKILIDIGAEETENMKDAYHIVAYQMGAHCIIESCMAYSQYMRAMNAPALNKDEILSETFVVSGAQVTQAYNIELHKLVEEANKTIVGGELCIKRTSPYNASIHASIDINPLDHNIENNTAKKIDGLVTFLSYVTTGIVSTLNDEYDNNPDVKHVNTSEFIRKVVNRTIDSAQAVSPIVKLFDQDEISKNIYSDMDDLDGVWYGIGNGVDTSAGRVNVFECVLSHKAWRRICDKAITDIVKQMDAKALRIALKMSMTPL
ncbi:MAG: hypothetical protein J6N72_07825 [Psychrobacter sp.]|nr:hypothetical protein [Psychrobacter sp.]